VRDTKSDVSAEARRNPLLAAERFLTQLNIKSQSITGRDKLFNAPETLGLLLVHRLGTSIPGEKQPRLIFRPAWQSIGSVAAYP